MEGTAVVIFIRVRKGPIKFMSCVCKNTSCCIKLTWMEQNYWPVIFYFLIWYIIIFFMLLFNNSFCCMVICILHHKILKLSFFCLSTFWNRGLVPEKAYSHWNESSYTEVYPLNIKCLTCIMLYDMTCCCLLSHQRARQPITPLASANQREHTGWEVAKLQ